GWYSTVGGGLNNMANNNSFVGGGASNRASGSASTIGGGTDNTAVGAGSGILGGSGNTATGINSCVLGGSSNTANASHVMVFGQGVTPSQSTSHRVYLFNGTAPGQLLLNTQSNPSSHVIYAGNTAHLTFGGTWTNASTRMAKDRFVQLNTTDILQKIQQLPVEGWFYKNTDEYHIGPYAEDFHLTFGTGVLNSPDAGRTLAASDVAGVALLGIKDIASQFEQLKDQINIQIGNAQEHQLDMTQKISQLQDENQELRMRIDSLENMLQQLLQHNSNISPNTIPEK
ncbi:MAG: hypothetical protein IAE67_05850, partial [Candidatus Competibacteraceae bacterium]|nr:hypothetical protein [Candidatus Competibacteraceae bacterium]